MTQEEKAAIAEIKAMTRKELDLVPFAVLHWECKIKFCHCFTRVRDYGLGTGEYYHPAWGWMKIHPAPEELEREGVFTRQLFFCGKHWRRYGKLTRAGDYSNVPVKRLENGGIPWGGNDTVKPEIIY